MAIGPVGAPARERAQAPGRRAVPRAAAPLRRALVGAQLRPGSALAPCAGRRRRSCAGRARARRRDGHGHGRRRAARARAARSSASTRAARCCRRRGRGLRRGEYRGRVELIEGEAERLPFCRRELRRADVHLPASLRRRSARRPSVSSRASCAPAGASGSLEFGVPPWAPARAAWRLYTAVGLPLGGRGRLARVARRRSLSRPEHHGLLRAPSGAADRRLLARGRA